jgi:hypothetical protein
MQTSGDFSAAGSVSCLPIYTFGSNTGSIGFGGGQIHGIGTGIWLNPLRPARLRTIAIAIRAVSLNNGFEANDTISSYLLRCPLGDPTPTSSECVEVDRFVFQNAASPTFQYGGPSGTQRTAASCYTGGASGVANGPCMGTWTIDGAGRATTDGDPIMEVGEANRHVIMYCSNAANSDFTADEGSNVISTWSQTAIIDWWN